MNDILENLLHHDDQLSTLMRHNSPVTERAHMIVGESQAISGNIKQKKNYKDNILIFGLYNILDLITIKIQTTVW